MKIKLGLSSLLFIVICYGCTKCQFQTPEIQKISISPDNIYLKIGDSIIIKTEFSIPDPDDLKFDWTAEFGKIKGNGNTVTYYAPDSVVSDIVEVTITGTDSAKRTSAALIKVFRQLVILKADDMVFDANTIIPQKWILFIDYIKSKGIKASIGVIGNSLEAGNDTYIKYLKSIAASGNFELWNHGYNHIVNGKYPNGQIYDEFYNTPYSYQYEHISRGDSLAFKKLGIIFHTFGAPGNAIDSVTVRAVYNQKDIKVWLFGLPGSTKLTLQRIAEIEFPFGIPVYTKFLRNYSSVKPYLVLQIHPSDWDEPRFNEFKKIIDFLIAKKVTFITPYDYYLLMNPEK